MLQVKDLCAGYGEADVLNGVCLEVGQGEIVALIGPNGAGKSTTLKSISGLLKARSGTISFGETVIIGWPPHRIVELGICQVPEGRRLFPRMTVAENLQLGGYIARAKGSSQEKMKKVFEVFPALEQRRNQIAATLSGGEQQMLAIGRALMAEPKLLLLDEPSLGLAPIIVRDIYNVIKEIHLKGTTIFLVEQNASLAMKLSRRVYIMERGRIIMSDLAKNLMSNEAVKRAYLGSGREKRKGASPCEEPPPPAKGPS